MTDEADSSVVLAELQVGRFRECNNQRLSPWSRPFSCSPDPVIDLCQNIYHGLPASLNMFCWYNITPEDVPFFSDATAISTSSQRIGCRSSSWGWVQSSTALSPQVS